MTDPKVHDANLRLLMQVREHIASAERLRDALERLLATANQTPTQPAKAVRHVAR